MNSILASEGVLSPCTSLFYQGKGKIATVWGDFALTEQNFCAIMISQRVANLRKTSCLPHAVFFCPKLSHFTGGNTLWKKSQTAFWRRKKSAVS
jgi:hypothetical protein